jgi:guanylate kinase
VILSGPSGVGKDTVLVAWQRANPRVHKVVSYTTRAPRTGEVDGVDYNFVDVPKFHEMARHGAFLEHKEVHGNYYATPMKDMDRMLKEGKTAVLKIDVQGAMTAMALRSSAITVFLLPPSWQELERRIRGRATDSESEIMRRLENAKFEMRCAERYQHCIVNDDLNRVVAQLEAIIA